MNYLTCFKSYDVRGELGVDLDESIVFQIGSAVAKHLCAKEVVVGYDARKSSPELAKALIAGILDYGANVLDIGLSGTEEMYSAVTQFNASAGIQVTASHNPINYNGLKFVQSGSVPLDNEKDFSAIKQICRSKPKKFKRTSGNLRDVSFAARSSYVRKILSFVDLDELKSHKIIVNSGNGAAGPTFDAIAQVFEEKKSSIEFIRMNHLPDHRFPNGIPNPILVENHAPMREMVLRHKADFGVAFDGDFDRCFFFDEKGEFVSGEYIVGLLASAFLNKGYKEKIVHDPRVVWNIQDIVKVGGGHCQISKTGHVPIKQTMREHGAVYGGELSGHHYFRDFSYCDSGMIPWLLILEIVSRSRCSLSALIDSRRRKFPSSGEINFHIDNPDRTIELIKKSYLSDSIDCCNFDGLSLEFNNWRLNIRKSNTEALIRLNIEAKNNKILINDKINELSKLINHTV